MQILSLGSTNRVSNMNPNQKIPAAGSALAGLLPTWVTPHVAGIIRSGVRRQQWQPSHPRQKLVCLGQSLLARGCPLG